MRVLRYRKIREIIREKFLLFFPSWFFLPGANWEARKGVRSKEGMNNCDLRRLKLEEGIALTSRISMIDDRWSRTPGPKKINDPLSFIPFVSLFCWRPRRVQCSTFGREREGESEREREEEGDREKERRRQRKKNSQEYRQYKTDAAATDILWNPLGTKKINKLR